jgi:hypothetical protein
MAQNKSKKHKGVSLAKGPVLIIGLALLAFGVLALLVGGAHGFTAKPPSGAVSGKQFLGLEVNGWSSLLFIGAGALLVFGSPLHWGAKAMSMLVGIGLIAAAVLALINKDSALGIFAANGLTELVWLGAGVLLLLLALLPRVGGGKKDDEESYDDRDTHGLSAKRVVERDRVTSEPTTRARADRSGRDTTWDERQDARVAAQANGHASESRQGSRRSH